MKFREILSGLKMGAYYKRSFWWEDDAIFAPYGDTELPLANASEPNAPLCIDDYEADDWEEVE